VVVDVVLDDRTCSPQRRRKGRVNTVYVRAESSDDVAAVSAQIENTIDEASVTTAADLAERVSGTLVDAKNLAFKLGAALAIVALLAAFLIASLLTLSSVTKRIREFGTLKATRRRRPRRYNARNELPCAPSARLPTRAKGRTCFWRSGLAWRHRYKGNDGTDGSARAGRSAEGADGAGDASRGAAGALD
jgi:hypothetical protein